MAGLDPRQQSTTAARLHLSPREGALAVCCAPPMHLQQGLRGFSTHSRSRSTCDRAVAGAPASDRGTGCLHKASGHGRMHRARQHALNAHTGVSSGKNHKSRRATAPARRPCRDCAPSAVPADRPHQRRCAGSTGSPQPCKRRKAVPAAAASPTGRPWSESSLHARRCVSI